MTIKEKQLQAVLAEELSAKNQINESKPSWICQSQIDWLKDANQIELRKIAASINALARAKEKQKDLLD